MSTAFINYFGNGLLIISIATIIILFSVWSSIAQSSSGGNPIFGNSTNTTHLRRILSDASALSNSTSTNNQLIDFGVAFGASIGPIAGLAFFCGICALADYCCCNFKRRYNQWCKPSPISSEPP